VYTVLAGNPEERDYLGETRRKDDNIKTGLKEIGYMSIDRNQLAQDRVQ